MAGGQLPARRDRERRQVSEGVRALRANLAQARHRVVPALAPRTHQREQLREGGDAGGRQALHQPGIEPAFERVLEPRRLDETGFHARERGVLAIAQATIAGALPIERGRRRRRIGLDIQRDELALAVERIGALALSASIPTGQGKRDLGFLRMNQRFYLRVQVDVVSWG